jgi:hypothetical protein
MRRLGVPPRWSLFAVLAATVAVATAAAIAASGAAAPGGPARAAASPSVPVAPIIAPKLACGDLVQSGGPPRPGVPDFANLRGAPTRIASATVVAATAQAPEYCDFRRHGGKLILYHGWADPAIPPTGTTAYYRAVEDEMGGAHVVQQFARLFMIPTMYHCNGGYGPAQFDMVGPIVYWVEASKAPDAVVTTQTDPSGNVVRTRPVFPYPKRARYTGTGSIDDAASFVSADPATPPDDHIAWLGEDLLHP